MPVTINLNVNLPEGFEASGEYRAPNRSEYFINHCKGEVELALTTLHKDEHRIILRRVAPKGVVLASMLRRGCNRVQGMGYMFPADQWERILALAVEIEGEWTDGGRNPV